MQVSGISSGIRTSAESFALPWAKLCAAYPRSENSKATVAIYHERLKKFDAEHLMAAVNIAIDRCKFFPTVAELIENIASLTESQTFLDEPRPSKEEAGAILAALHEQIRQSESADLKSTEKRIADRKAELSQQAKRLGVTTAKIKAAKETMVDGKDESETH